MSRVPDLNPEREPDIVLVVLQRVRAINPALTEEQALLVEATVRAEFGGLRVRIPKRKKHPSPEQRKASAAEAIGSAATDAELTQRHGISRATLYRHIKRGA